MKDIKQEVENKIKEEFRNGEFDMKRILYNEIYFDLCKTKDENSYLPLGTIAEIIKNVFKPEEIKIIITLLKNNE